MTVALSTNIELTMRSIALFISVFLAARWYRKSQPKWDVYVAIIAIICGLVLGTSEKLIS